MLVALLNLFSVQRLLVLLVFIFVTCAVFILPSPSVFISSLPDSLRPEMIFLLVFLVLRLVFSRKFVKFSLEFSFPLAIFSMIVSLAWATAGLGIPIMPQDFIDIFLFLVYWSVFRYGYELTVRYDYDFIKIVTLVILFVVVIQLIVVFGQRMNIRGIINISSWWSHDYDTVPWLRVTRPHGMTANAITLSILMALFFSYLLGQVLSKSNTRSIRLLSLIGMVLSFLIVVLTKSRTGFVLIVAIPFLFAFSAKSYFRSIMISSLKIIGVMIVVGVVMFSVARGTGYQGKFVIGSAALELVDRIGNFAREGLQEKEGAVGRIDDARMAFSQLSESPYVGIGPAHSLGKSWFHSSYITLVRRYGIIGLFFYLTPYLLVLFQSCNYFIRNSDKTDSFSLAFACLALCVMVGGITNYTFIGEWQMNFFFWLIAGVVVGIQRVRYDATPNGYLA